MGEHLPYKQRVIGSSPILSTRKVIRIASRTNFAGSADERSVLLALYFPPYADLAHLVERHLAKVEVAGSSPVIRSKKYRRNCLRYFFIQTAGLVYHHALACISSAPLELYIITRKSVFSCGLM